MTMTPYYINSPSPLGLSHLNFFSVIFFTDFSVFSYFVNLQTIQLVINNIALHLSFQSRALIHSYNKNFFLYFNALTYGCNSIGSAGYAIHSLVAALWLTVSAYVNNINWHNCICKYIMVSKQLSICSQGSSFCSACLIGIPNKTNIDVWLPHL